MNSLLDILIRYRDYIVFVILLIISLLLITKSNNDSVSGFKAFMLTRVGIFQEFISVSTSEQSIESENRALRKMNLNLSDKLVRSRKSSVENEKLRRIIAFKQTFEKEVIPAEIIGKNRVNINDYLTISVGLKDSVKRGMPVRTDIGLVGQIILVTEKYSLVEPIKNKNVKVAVSIVEASVSGYAEWNGKDFLLKNISETIDIHPGDFIVTSNYSNLFPANIPYGKVKSVTTAKNSMFWEIIIDVNVDFATLSQVFVIKEVRDTNRVNMISELERRQKIFN